MPAPSTPTLQPHQFAFRQKNACQCQCVGIPFSNTTAVRETAVVEDQGLSHDALSCRLGHLKEAWKFVSWTVSRSDFQKFEGYLLLEIAGVGWRFVTKCMTKWMLVYVCAAECRLGSTFSLTLNDEVGSFSPPFFGGGWGN